MITLNQLQFDDLVDRLRYGLPLSPDQQKIVAALARQVPTNDRDSLVDKLHEAYRPVDPNKPIELLVEYVGACKRRGDGRRHARFPSGRNNPWLGTPPFGAPEIEVEAYASAWVEGGWTVRFPEDVLKAYFGEPEVPFDGDFRKLLLSAEDLPKAYKRLARKYHPDLNQGRREQFLKLKAAYDDLRDPMVRKRYEAGLHFQEALVKKKDDIVFRCPKNCGRVLVCGVWVARQDDRDAMYDRVSSRFLGVRLDVTDILSWEDVYDEQGRLMCSNWRRPIGGGFGQRRKQDSKEKPFDITFEYQGADFEVTV